MSIRKKLFFLLLAFSLIPLLVVSVISRQGILNLGQAQSIKLRSGMIDILRGEMQQSAVDSAKMIQQQAVSLEFALKAIVAETEDVLNDPVNGLPKVFFSDDFMEKSKQPADFKPSEPYFKIEMSGKKTPTSISLEEPVFYVTKDKNFLKQDQNVARLYQLKPELKSFYSEAGTALHRIYITLNSGLHMAYPGHAGYPSDYDPQRRDWFTQAVENDHLIWGKFIDASTNQQIFTLSKAVKGRGGKVLGVAAIDIQLIEILRQNDLSSQWSSALQAFVVAPLTINDKQQLHIWAESGHEEKAISWRAQTTNTIKVLDSSNKAKLTRIIDDISKGKSGVARLPYNGVDSVWAYAPFRGSGSYVLVVPEKVITEIPDAAAEQILDLSWNLYIAIGTTAFIILIAVSLVAFLGSKKIIAPLMIMTDAAKKIADGDLSIHVEIDSTDERKTLADAFNSMVPKLQDHLRISKSMELAQEVHSNLLPEVSPQIDGLDISGISISCDETGGDYFDYYEAPEGAGLGILLGDVTGHGVSAALLMATGRAHLKHASTHKASLPSRIEDVNKQLCLDIGDTGRFMTLFCMEISPDNSTATYVRAGHDPAAIYNPSTGEQRELMGDPMLALGVFDESEYDDFTVELHAGEIIFIGTDGIWEARNSKDEMFGRKRMDKIIMDNAEKPAIEIQDLIIRAVVDFQGKMEQEDDITLVIIKVNHLNKGA